MRLLLVILVSLSVAGCSGYEFKNLAKSDVDLVTDEFFDESRRLVRELTVKLYKRNPSQLHKTPGMTIEKRLTLLQNSAGELNFVELAGRQETEALELVFNPDFDGDRVFALAVGLGGMLRHAYGYNDESFLFDSLEPKPLWTSAHNVEVLAWKLRNNRMDNGAPWLISSEYQGVTDNLSFERLFGKLIVLQEMMARIAGDADDRRVTKVVHAAGSVFMPLPI
jgi:hypothetical protein